MVIILTIVIYLIIGTLIAGLLDELSCSKYGKGLKEEEWIIAITCWSILLAVSAVKMAIRKTLD
jgi:ethanolamine transporter EutH